MAQTFTARQVARIITTKVGREVDAKRVRAWVRDHIDAFDDDGYTSHVYDAKQRDTIVAAFVTKAKGATGQPARAKSASVGRKGTKGASPTAPSATRGRGTKPPQTMASDKAADAEQPNGD